MAHNDIPRHIAIIMDGNGRWAKKRGLPRIFGHKVGVESVREVIKTCSKLGVEYLTLYTFSKENWKRPKEEVDTLMEMMKTLLKREVDELHRNNVRIRAIGTLKDLPSDVYQELLKAMDLTKDNTGLKLYLAISYSGRAEIVDAVKKIMHDYQENKISSTDLNEEVFKHYLYDEELPDPDLLIRTSGEMRISNFLLWQIAYTEIYVTPVHWPDFRKRELLKAIEDYKNRERRFGGVSIE